MRTISVFSGPKFLHSTVCLFCIYASSVRKRESGFVNSIIFLYLYTYFGAACIMNVILI